MRSMFENSSCVRPRSRMRPSAITTMRSAKSETTSISWQTMITAQPRSAMVAHCFHDGHALAVIKAARGLVEHHDFGLYDHDGGECHHLALTAREREGASSAGRPKRSMTSWARRRASARSMPPSSRPKADLVEHGVLADLAVGVLEEGRDLASDAARGNGCGIQSRDAHAARGGLKQACEQFGERGLAGAVLADDAHELARIERQAKVVYGGSAIGIANSTWSKVSTGSASLA